MSTKSMRGQALTTLVLYAGVFVVLIGLGLLMVADTGQNVTILGNGTEEIRQLSENVSAQAVEESSFVESIPLIGTIYTFGKLLVNSLKIIVNRSIYMTLISTVSDVLGVPSSVMGFVSILLSVILAVGIIKFAMNR